MLSVSIAEERRSRERQETTPRVSRTSNTDEDVIGVEPPPVVLHSELALGALREIELGERIITLTSELGQWALLASLPSVELLSPLAKACKASVTKAEKRTKLKQKSLAAGAATPSLFKARPVAARRGLAF